MRNTSKTILLLMSLLFFLSSATLFADTTKKFCNIRYKTLNNFTCDDSANLNGVTIQGNVKIKGSANIINATIDGTLTVGGDVTLLHSKIKGSGDSKTHGDLNLDGAGIYGPINVDGSLNVNRSTIRGLVTSNGTAINIYEGALQGGLVVNSKIFSIITLDGNSEVDGAIIFSHKAGKVVFKDSRSSVKKVVNGKTVGDF